MAYRGASVDTSTAFGQRVEEIVATAARRDIEYDARSRTSPCALEIRGCVSDTVFDTNNDLHAVTAPPHFCRERTAVRLRVARKTRGGLLGWLLKTMRMTRAVGGGLTGRHRAARDAGHHYGS